MTSPLILFNRSLLDRLSGLAPLNITGTLPEYAADVAYSNRLQINNAVGACTVEWLGGELPPGATVWVDNTTHEVVVEWPPYAVPSPTMTDVPNGDVGLGVAGMRLGAGWSINTAGVMTGPNSLQYDGAGSSTVVWPMVPCAPGTSVTATIDVKQGASSAGNVAARVALVFYDANRAQIPGAWEGNIISNGAHGAIAASTVTAVSPPGTAYSAIAANATRKRQNKPLWVDTARWNLAYPTGTPGEEDFALSIRVLDSVGRVAYWSGTLSELYTYFTSRPFAEVLPVADFITSGLAITGGEFRIPPPPYTAWPAESITATLSILGGTLAQPLRSYVSPVEGLASSVSITGGELRQTLKSYTQYAPEAVTASAALTGGSLAVKLIQYNNYAAEVITSSVAITGGTLA